MIANTDQLSSQVKLDALDKVKLNYIPEIELRLYWWPLILLPNHILVHVVLSVLVLVIHIVMRSMESKMISSFVMQEMWRINALYQRLFMQLKQIQQVHHVFIIPIMVHVPKIHWLLFQIWKTHFISTWKSLSIHTTKYSKWTHCQLCYKRCSSCFRKTWCVSCWYHWNTRWSNWILCNRWNQHWISNHWCDWCYSSWKSL